MNFADNSIKVSPTDFSRIKLFVVDPLHTLTGSPQSWTLIIIDDPTAGKKKIHVVNRQFWVIKYGRKFEL